MQRVVQLFANEGASNQQQFTLREVFQTRIKRGKEKPQRWDELLHEFQNQNTLFSIKPDPERSEHEYGSGGFRETTYRVTDKGGNTYFIFRRRAEWTTTPDDSTDYSEPSQITILAVLPLMEELVNHFIEETTSMIAHAG